MDRYSLSKPVPWIVAILKWYWTWYRNRCKTRPCNFDNLRFNHDLEPVMRMCARCDKLQTRDAVTGEWITHSDETSSPPTKTPPILHHQKLR
jgi:hypothetical protein